MHSGSGERSARPRFISGSGETALALMYVRASAAAAGFGLGPGPSGGDGCALVWSPGGATGGFIGAFVPGCGATGEVQAEGWVPHAGSHWVVGVPGLGLDLGARLGVMRRLRWRWNSD